MVKEIHYDIRPLPETISLSPPPSAWHGQLQLEFCHRHGETQVSHSHVQAPLKVQRPFYPEGKAVCHSVMLHTAGGIVGGDRLSFTIQLQPQARALLTTVAAAKAYRSSGATAQQTTTIRVGEAACLEWFPLETIVFDGAIYHQRTRIELAADATWCGWELTRFGRSARGERFTSGEWRSHTEVWQNDQLVWVDPQGLQGGSNLLESPHGLAGCSVVGSLAFVGREVSPEVVATIRQLQRATAGSDEGTATVGVTRLMTGLLCRYRGHSTEEARRWFLQVWEVLRQTYQGRPACVPRVWQM